MLFLTDECSHVVGREGMETRTPKSEFVVATQHLCLPVGPQPERRMSTPNGMLPKKRECCGLLQKTACKVRHFFSLLDLRYRAAGVQACWAALAHSTTSLMASGGCWLTDSENWFDG